MTQKYSIRDIVLHYLADQRLKEGYGWVPGYKLIKLRCAYGFTGTSGMRRAQEMAEFKNENNELEKKYEKGYVYFRITKQAMKAIKG